MSAPIRLLFSRRPCRHPVTPLNQSDLGPGRIERIRAHARARGRVVVHLACVAILAIVPTDCIRWRNEARPYRSRRTLRNGFELEGRSLFARGDALLDLRAKFRRHMAPKLGLDPAW